MKALPILLCYLGAVHITNGIMIAHDAPLDAGNVFTAAASQARRALELYKASEKPLGELIQSIKTYCPEEEETTCPYQEIQSLCFQSERFIKDSALVMLESISQETQASIEARLIDEEHVDANNQTVAGVDTVRDDLEFLHSYHEQGIRISLALGNTWGDLAPKLDREVIASLSPALTLFLTKFGEGNQNLRETHSFYKKGLEGRLIKQNEQIVADGIWGYNLAIIVGTATAITLPIIAYFAYKYGRNTAAAAAVANMGEAVLQSPRKLTGSLGNSFKNLFADGGPFQGITQGRRASAPSIGNPRSLQGIHSPSAPANMVYTPQK